MSDHVMQRSLLEEIDARQEEVLSQLHELNQRVEALLKETLAARQADVAADE